MARKRYKPEEIVAKLRQVDVLVSQGQPMADAIRQIGVSEVTYYRWRHVHFDFPIAYDFLHFVPSVEDLYWLELEMFDRECLEMVCQSWRRRVLSEDTSIIVPLLGLDSATASRRRP
jgi:hypothetical protein